MTSSTSPLRHVILCPVGSAGDVHPLLGLGRVLRQRGVRVTLATAGYFRRQAEDEGFEFLDTLPDADFRAMVGDPRIWQPRHAVRLVMSQGVRPILERLYRLIERHQTPDETLLVGTSLAIPARVAQEKLGIPLVTVHLAPSLFRSNHEGPRLKPAMVHVGPAWFRRAQWWFADRFLVDPCITPWLNEFRHSLGLPPVTRVMADWWNSPLRILGMFPSWFFPPQPDWPSQLRLTGFPLYSEEGVTAPSAEVAEFMQAGSPPLVFTPGSANVFGGEFFAAAADACVRLGRRGLLLTRFPEQIPTNLPATVRHVDFVPFRWLIPRAAALVHHGGVGTMSQALAAGVPQVIMPLAFDQHDNAHRCEHLGVARTLPPSRFRGPALAALLAGLLDNPAVATRCRAAALQIAGHDGLATACDELERAWDEHRQSRQSTPHLHPKAG